MKKFGYDARLSTGTVACGSTLGVVIPPSVVLIVIGLSTEQSIAKLFYGGIGAGLVLATLMILSVALICRRHPHWGPAGPRFSLAERFSALSGAFETLLLFALVMIGLYFGVFTPTEAGAAGSFLAVAIGVGRGGLSWKGFRAAVEETLRVSCMVITIVAGAVIFGRFLAVTRIPYDIADWVVGLPVPPVGIMIIIFAIFVVGGMVMDALALLLITIPIFFPVAQSMGLDPIWFAALITVVTTMGAITPPVGVNTFIVASMAQDVALPQVFRGVSIFMLCFVICVTTMMVFPEISTFLPGLLH
jgi:tripartite ATP-independent transporter DctM subunit